MDWELEVTNCLSYLKLLHYHQLMPFSAAKEVNVIINKQSEILAVNWGRTKENEWKVVAGRRPLIELTNTVKEYNTLFMKMYLNKSI